MKHTFKPFFAAAAVICMMAIFFSACKKDKSDNPVANKISPDSASGGVVLTLTGSGLADMRSIVFDNANVPAPFNPTLNSDGAIIFRVPDTAYGGPQNIIFTNADGRSVSVPFKVIALPTISDVSNYNFTGGTEITLTGNNLDDVSSVVFTGNGASVTIVSQVKRSMVIRMPASTFDRSTLDITNTSGKMTTSQEFVNMDNAYKIFTDDYGPTWENASWGPAAISSTVAKSGTKSFAATYNQGNWSADGFASWNVGMTYDASYKFLTFWVKGGSQDYTLYVTGDKRAGGYGNSDQTAPINISANVWNYFKIPLSSLDLWHSGNVFKQLGFWIKGPDPQTETFYYDDVMIIK
jgi:hypothetical protein